MASDGWLHVELTQPMGFFRLGKDSIRFTKQYLRAGRLRLLPYIRIFLIHEPNKEAGDAISVVGLKVYMGTSDLKGSDPWRKVYRYPCAAHNDRQIDLHYNEDGSKATIDCDRKSKEELMDHLVDTFGAQSESTKRAVINPTEMAMFGEGYERFCPCEMTGQVPCPGRVALPKGQRGKYQVILGLDAIDEEEAEARAKAEQKTPP